ncbi:MAG: hypothetical protein ABEH40_01205 [Haloferacaceae archaeon]
MGDPSSPYVFRGDPVDPTAEAATAVEGGGDTAAADADGTADAGVVIVDGRAMSYRRYRR